jgi:hypothetical protein
MYEVDRRDSVVQLDGVPQSSPGAPMPVVVASEHTLQLAYLRHGPEPDWNDPASIDRLREAEPCALVRFEQPYAYLHGPPNDEAFAGHPLASRGLTPYGAFQVERSSWIRLAEHRNRVHSAHDPSRFEALRHYVFTFHDSTFECLARGLDAIELDGPLSHVLRQMAEGTR